ncbi:MAG: hypothetical protein ACREJD_15685 [Phycisphaerales bacterium]
MATPSLAKALILAIAICSLASLVSCASSAPAPSPAASMRGSFTLRNDSASTLTVQPFEATEAGGTREPLHDAFTISPGQTDTRTIGTSGKLVVLTIRASDQNFKYQSGEWVVPERATGFYIYAFTDNSGTVRLSWNNRGGEVILMQ